MNLRLSHTKKWLLVALLPATLAFGRPPRPPGFIPVPPGGAPPVIIPLPPGGGGGYVPGHSFTVHCASAQYRLNVCSTGTRIRNVRIYRQYSSADCVRGRTWGYDPRGTIWVDRGCRATFLVTTGFRPYDDELDLELSEEELVELDGSLDE
jgi:hypothetical protein